MRSFFIIIILLSFPASAQSFKAIASYQKEYRIPPQMSGMELSDEQIQRISRRMGAVEPRDYDLLIASERSGFILQAGTKGGRQGGMMDSSGDLYKDTKNRVLLNRVVWNDTVYVVKDTLREFDWQLHDITIEIGPLVCYKATASVEVPSSGMRGGRRSESAEIVAWYCPEIKSDQGPGRYWGLPGLILEVEEPNAITRCTNIELYPENFRGVTFPEDGKAITAAEYASKLKAFWEARREARSNRN